MSGRDFDPFADRAQPPMSPELFAMVVAARLRASRPIEVLEQRGLELQLHVRGEPVTAHLDPYYRRYRADPQNLTPLVQGLIEDLQGEATGPQDAFQAVAERLMPLLITSEQWQDRRSSGLRLAVRPLVRDLGTALVIDEPGGLSFVQLEMLADWGVDPATAYDTATLNLERLAQEVDYTRKGEGDETLLIDRTGDGYAAARAILPGRLADWAGRVSGHLVLGLPTSNFLIGFSREHPALRELAEQVKQDARTRPDGLFPHLLIYREGVLHILE